MPQKVISIRPRIPRAGAEARPRYDGAPLADTRGRPMRDLRISVTDRCNFRCTYCMPREVFDADYKFLPHAAILSFEEIARLAGIFVGLGVKKIRLTGGEPLLRKGLPDLVAMLAPLGADLTLTTNGSTLVKHARALKDAGLDRITVSLDSLDEATFRAMNDADFPVEKVLDGIAAAADAGFSPVKINMVVKRGVNDHQIVEAARHWRDSGHILRFIEFMDVGSTNGWRMDDVIPSAEVVRRISEAFPLEPVEANYAGEVAERWRYKDGAGEIGVISSVTQAFCARLQPHAPVHRGLALHLPVRPAGPRPEIAAARRRRRRRDPRFASPPCGALRDDRYSEIRTAETAKNAQSGDVLHRWLSTHRPQLTNAARPATFEVEATNERGEMVPTSIAGEHPLTLYLDKRELVTLMTLGHAPEALAIGFLRNQRLVAGIEDIEAVQVDWETDSVAVTTNRQNRHREEDPQEDGHHRLRPGHGVRRPDGGDRQRQAARRRDARGRGPLRAAREGAQARNHLQAGGRGARLRAGDAATARS